MKNKGAANTAIDTVAVAVVLVHAHSNADKLVLEYNNHPAYDFVIPVISSPGLTTPK